jgi:hypothetical protein
MLRGVSVIACLSCLAVSAAAAPGTGKLNGLGERLAPAEIIRATTRRFVEENTDFAQYAMSADQKQCIAPSMRGKVENLILDWFGNGVDNDEQVDELLQALTAGPGKTWVTVVFHPMFSGGMQPDAQAGLDAMTADQMTQFMGSMVSAPMQKFFNYAPAGTETLEQAKTVALEADGVIPQ